MSRLADRAARRALKEAWTSLDEQTYQAILRALTEQGRPPTQRELAHALGIQGTTSVNHRLERLVRHGRIVTDVSRARGIRIVGVRWVAVPETQLEALRSLLQKVKDTRGALQRARSLEERHTAITWLACHAADLAEHLEQLVAEPAHSVKVGAAVPRAIP